MKIYSAIPEYTYGREYNYHVLMYYNKFYYGNSIYKYFWIDIDHEDDTWDAIDSIKSFCKKYKKL